MKSSTIAIMALALVTLFTSCNDYETYGEKKEKERDAIKAFINDSAYNVISEAQFHSQGDVTDVSANQFVYLDKSGVYMQIVRKSCGSPIQDGENLNMLCRFTEINIESNTGISNAYNNVFDVDKIYIYRVGSTYTASFTSGIMYSKYGASVPAGWIVPLNYINIGRPVNDDDELAFVRLIVPHSQGHSIASQYVYPYYYEITYQRGR